MNLLTGLLIALCLIAFVSADGHQSRRQNFKVFKQRRNTQDNLRRRGNYGDLFEEETIFSPSPLATTTTGTIPSGTGTITTTPVALFNKNKSNKYHLDQLVNSFDQEDLDDMFELQRPRRRKNREQSNRRRHRHRQHRP